VTVEPMKCWCPVSCADTYLGDAIETDREGRVTHPEYLDAAGPNGALTFVCIWCRCPTPWCCGGSGDALDDRLCDRCWGERHPDIEAEIERETRELEVAL
jgi:hypothetical protein